MRNFTLNSAGLLVTATTLPESGARNGIKQQLMKMEREFFIYPTTPTKLGSSSFSIGLILPAVRVGMKNRALQQKRKTTASW